MGNTTNTRRYKARASEWGLGESSKGTKQIAVSFNILTENADMQRITWYGYFGDASWERTIESLRHCGWTGEDLSELEGTKGGLDANEVELVIADEDYTDPSTGEVKTSTKVQWVNKAGGLALNAPLAPDAAKSFAAQMREKIRAKAAAGGQKMNPPARSATPPPQATPNGSLKEEDVPF